MKVYIIFGTNGKRNLSATLDFIKEPFLNLNISSDLKNGILQRIDAEQDFEVAVTELQEILPTLDTRIEELLKHPDFDPFKEEKRKRYPQQYGNNPFEYKGVTYYLYSKLNPIDSLINRIIGFKKLIEEHIAANKPLRYVYKE
ncbi:hypothetical protein [Chryseobacterium salviniae]|uniref:Uncharacterized protein n=1 Tax=Chryseobacterium salviniae TaxID=3101750 RepID=A0ABU6HTW4_9FLAO|nr:hypothetical protein [Chryseobacterium sp. T9W2-O]MEC3876496.1 hypothetical protein [Chryseobacterium sp. T9W2-O]